MDKIICIGKNYAEHARELGDAVPERPVLFLKPPSVLAQTPATDQWLEATLPEGRGEVHFECEIVVRVARDGTRWSVAEAAAAFDAVTLGLDLTLREEQGRLKKAGHPWEISKVFADSALLGAWVTGAEIPALLDSEFQFALEGQVRQRGRAAQMIFSVAECLAHASRYFPLRAGDLVFTGTPAGVGPVLPGQSAELHWNKRLLLKARWRAAATPAP